MTGSVVVWCLTSESADSVRVYTNICLITCAGEVANLPQGSQLRDYQCSDTRAFDSSSSGWASHNSRPAAAEGGSLD